MKRPSLRIRIRVLLLVTAALIALWFDGFVMSGAAAADTPQLFVTDRVDGLTLTGTVLFWKTDCGDDLSPSRSRLRRTSSRGAGGIAQTLYFPANCQVDRVASANVAVDDVAVFWITGNGRLVKLARAATAGTAPTLVWRTGLSSVGGFVSCCSVAVDATHVYWNENRRIMRLRKNGGVPQRMMTAAASVRDLRARGDGALFFREGPRLRVLLPFASAFAPVDVAGAVTDYALTGTRVFWLSNVATGYAVRSKTRSALDGLQTHYSSPPTAGLHADTIAADGANVYWHQVAGSGGGPVYKLALAGGVAQTLTSNLAMGIFLVSDSQFLFWTDYSTGIYRLPVTPSAPITGDIRITGIEVTQGIQVYDGSDPTRRNRIPLVGDKLTVVRVYAQATNDASGPWNDVTATLQTSDGTGFHRPLNAYTRAVTTAGSNRRTLDDSFTFILDPAATTTGERTLRAEIHSVSGRPEANLANNSSTVAVAFGPARSVQIYGFTYANTANGVACADAAPNATWPAPGFWEPHRQWFENAYPISSLGILRLPGDPVRSFDNSDCRAGQRAHTWLTGEIDHLFPSGRVRANLLMPEDTVEGWCCSGSNGNAVTRGGNSLTYPGETMAQEQAHATFPCPTCNCHTFNSCYGYPFPDQSIGPQVGVKIRPALELRPGRNLDGSVATFDVMSYDDPQWVSPFTYCGLLSALSGSAVGCPSGVSASSRKLGVASPLEPFAGKAAGLYLYVGGAISPSNVAELVPFDIVVSGKNLSTPSAGKDFVISLEDAQSMALASYSFDATAHRHPGDIPPTLFSAYLPWNEKTVRIRLRRGSTLLSERKVSPHDPEIEVEEPLGGGTLGGQQRVAWHASDADGDSLWFSIEYSPDDGATWLPLDRELTTSSAVVNLDSVPGAAAARLRVVATDGVNTANDEVDLPFAVPFKRPEVTLTGVKDGATFGVNARFLLAATAFDWEDGAITAQNQLSWRSDLDGPLGRGAWIVPQLSPGQHTVSVTVRDSSGMRAVKSVRVTVLAK